MKEEKQCVYCGEEKAQVKIMSPNMGDEEDWDVCITCKKIIAQQQKLTLGAIMSERELGRDFGEKLMKEAQKEIHKLSYESGKEVISIGIKK